MIAKETNTKDLKIEIKGASVLSPHNRAIYEAGKSILIDSAKVGREFCKLMITLSSGAIPIYLGILKFVFPEHYTLCIFQGLIILAPIVFYLFSLVLFTIGYYPKGRGFSLNIIDEIDRERARILNKRAVLSFWGFVLYLIGTICGISVIVFNI